MHLASRRTGLPLAAGAPLSAGLIERKAGRGRAIWHRLTPKGQSVLRKGYDVIGDVLDVSFGPLSRRQRELLYRFLKQALEDGEPAQRVGF
jgi:DNA-binding MarR family transcriptional regulator